MSGPVPSACGQLRAFSASWTASPHAFATANSSSSRSSLGHSLKTNALRPVSSTAKSDPSFGGGWQRVPLVQRHFDCAPLAALPSRAMASSSAPSGTAAGAAAQFLSKALANPVVCIGDLARVQQKVAALIAGGPNDLHIISDFDMTLTKYDVNGQRNTTSHAVVANSSRTPQKMKDETDALYQHYYPIEVSHELSPEEKFQHMEDWWHKVHAVIVDAGLTRGDLEHMVADSPIVWREGIPQLMGAADAAGVPLLVFSAGLADVITEVLRSAGLLTGSMHVISNRMIFEESPPHRVIGFDEPVIHVFNKNEGALAAAHVPYFQEVAHRGNVLLLGDSLGDLRMSEGMSHSALLTVGFLNHDVPQLLPQYKERYDIVLTGDAPATLLCDLLQLVAEQGSSSVADEAATAAASAQ